MYKMPSINAIQILEFIKTTNPEKVPKMLVMLVAELKLKLQKT